MGRKKRYTYNFDTAYFKEVKRMNCEVLRLLFKNNAYLLKVKGITLYRQIKDLNENDIKLDYGNIHKLKSGKEFRSSLSYLNFFCCYWGKSLGELVSYDLEERAKMLAEAAR